MVARTLVLGLALALCHAPLPAAGFVSSAASRSRNPRAPALRVLRDLRDTGADNPWDDGRRRREGDDVLSLGVRVRGLWPLRCFLVSWRAAWVFDGLRFLCFLALMTEALSFFFFFVLYFCARSHTLRSRSVFAPLLRPRRGEGVAVSASALPLDTALSTAADLAADVWGHRVFLPMLSVRVCSRASTSTTCCCNAPYRPSFGT